MFFFYYYFVTYMYVLISIMLGKIHITVRFTFIKET